LNSNIKSAVEQGHLLLSRADAKPEVPLTMILQRKTLLGAINLCIELSGLEAKEIYLPLGIDAGHFTNLRKGQGHFPTDKISDLMDLCGNEVPLVWQAHQRGYGLVVLKSEAERLLELAQHELAAERLKVRVLTEAINGRTA
jgi:hypothetical protein